MKILPRIRIVSSSLILSLFLLTLLPAKSLAASVYFEPVSGFINSTNPLLSVFVESTTTEPEIASANIQITYPTNVEISEIDTTTGEFDSYIQKSVEGNTITINAVNNAGNYKSGVVKLASIRLNVLANNEKVDLTITPDSEITGAGGEQLLTETINASFTINLSPEEAALLEGAGAIEEITEPEPTVPQETATVPETGWNNIPLYAGVSAGLLVLGLANFVITPNRRKQ